jgi:hypothetical protein
MESANAEGSNVPGTCNNAWKPLTQAEVDQIAAFRFNSVRLPIAWGNIEPTAPTAGPGGTLVHHWNAPYIAALQEEVHRLGAAGLMVVLDMHQSAWSPQFTTAPTAKRPGCPGQGMPVWLNPTGTATTSQQASCAFYAGITEPGVPGTAWSDFAAAEAYVDGLFAGDPTVVAQDIVNEPYCGKPTTNLTGFYDQVVPVVHASNPNLLLMLEDKDEPGTYELTALPAVPNLVLSIHLHEDYWTDPTAGQAVLPVDAHTALVTSFSRAQSWGVPLYVGEFYAFDASRTQSAARAPDANWVADTATFLAYCKANAISWSYWSWVQKKHPEEQPAFTPPVRDALTAAG